MWDSPAGKKAGIPTKNHKDGHLPATSSEGALRLLLHAAGFSPTTVADNPFEEESFPLTPGSETGHPSRSSRLWRARCNGSGCSPTLASCAPSGHSRRPQEIQKGKNGNCARMFLPPTSPPGATEASPLFAGERPVWSGPSVRPQGGRVQWEGLKTLPAPSHSGRGPSALRAESTRERHSFY